MEYTLKLDKITIIENLPFKLDQKGNLWVYFISKVEDLLIDTIELDEGVDEFEVEITQDMFNRAIEHSTMACASMIDLESGDSSRPFHWMVGDPVVWEHCTPQDVLEAHLMQVIEHQVSYQWPYDTNDVAEYFRDTDEYSVALDTLEVYRQEWLAEQELGDLRNAQLDFDDAPTDPPAVLEALDFVTDNTEVRFVPAKEQNELHDVGEKYYSVCTPANTSNVSWHTRTFDLQVNNATYRIVHRQTRGWTGSRNEDRDQVWIYKL